MKSSTLRSFPVVVRALLPSRPAAVRAGELFLSVAVLAFTSCGGDSSTAPADPVAPPALNVALNSPSMQIDSLSGSTCVDGAHPIAPGGQVPVSTGVCAISHVTVTLYPVGNTVRHVFVRDSTEVISVSHAGLSGDATVKSTITPDTPGIWRVYLCKGGTTSATSPCGSGTMMDSTSFRVYHVLPIPLSLTVDGPRSDTVRVKAVLDGVTLTELKCLHVCNLSYDTVGTMVTLHAGPDAGDRFTGWSGDIVGTSPDTTVEMTDAVSVTAHFEKLPRTLTIDMSGAAGTVTDSSGHVDCTSSASPCSVKFLDGTIDTLRADNSASAFYGWSGACTGTSTCIVTMDADKTVGAAFVAGVAVSVTEKGTGSGSVTSSPDGIDCPGACTAYWVRNTTVTLTASAAGGSEFTSWSGCSTTAGNTCTVTTGGLVAPSVTATFTTVAHTLTVTKSGTGSGTVSSDKGAIDCGTSCSDNYAEGTSVTLSETPAAGSVFTGWSGACTGTGDCTVSMSADESVTATFTAVTHTLTVTKSGAGSGTVSSDKGTIDCGTTCSDNYAEGTTVTLSASKGANSTFNGWTGDACDGSTAATCDVTIGSSDVSVDALFKADQKLTWTTAPPASGEYGTTFTVVAKSTSLVTNATTGLAPTYSVSGTCSVDPTTGKVTFDAGGGTCTVYADQGGDGDYNAATQISGAVTMIPQATSVALSVTPGSQQYSDQVGLEAHVTPYQALSQQLTGQVDFYVESAAVTCAAPGATAVGTVAVADADDGVAKYTYAIGRPAGSYVVTACFTSSSAYFGSSGADDGSLTVSAEDATVSEDSYPDYALVNTAVTFNFSVSETSPELNADQSLVAPGDLNNATADVVLSPVGGGGNVTVACTPGSVSGTGYNQVRSFQCSTSGLDVDAYEVTTTVMGGYYRGSDDATLTIYDPSLGFPSGGGTFVLDGEKVNFGFSFALQGHGKSATQRGHILVMRHRANGDVCRVKSNQLGPAAVDPGNAVATFSGQANYVCTTPDGVTYDGAGNLNLYGWVQDNGTPGSATPDEFWVNVETTNSTLAMPTPAADNAQPLTGGDIFVPQS